MKMLVGEWSLVPSTGAIHEDVGGGMVTCSQHWCYTGRCRWGIGPLFPALMLYMKMSVGEWSLVPSTGAIHEDVGGGMVPCSQHWSYT